MSWLFHPTVWVFSLVSLLVLRRSRAPISHGVGMERANAPQLRFLCRPQIIVIDLLPLRSVG